jgi:pyrroline-5-carboxylate reductase
MYEIKTNKFLFILKPKISVKMREKSLGFIGGGRITRIFLQAFENKNADFSSIIVSDTNTDVLNKLKDSFPKISVTDSPSVPAKQDIVFIALHPPVIMEVLGNISHGMNENTTLVSLAPKISIEKLATESGNIKNIVRLIPNATSVINEGYNPVCFAPETHNRHKEALLEIFRLLGHTFEVPEAELESYAILSAMLPTYFWFQWKELTDIGIKMGLSPEKSTNAVRDTMLAALRTFFYSGMQPNQVMDLIPVKPLAEAELQIREIYQDKLTALFQKIKP